MFLHGGVAANYRTSASQLFGATIPQHHRPHNAESRPAESATALGSCASRTVVQSPAPDLCDRLRRITVRASNRSHVTRILTTYQTLRCHRHRRWPRRLRSLCCSSAIRRPNSPHNAQARQPRRVLVQSVVWRNWQGHNAPRDRCAGWSGREDGG